MDCMVCVRVRVSVKVNCSWVCKACGLGVVVCRHDSPEGALLAQGALLAPASRT